MTEQTDPLAQLQLGKAVEYAQSYSPALLQGVPRSLSRDAIGVSEPLPFTGTDLWYGYELSWLTPKGKPQVGILECRVPITSPNLIESKSFKLYLNSLNQHPVADIPSLESLLRNDLSAVAGAAVEVKVYPPSAFNQFTLGELPGTCIDDADISIDRFELDPSVLKTSAEDVEETLVSHLLKSNCLITNQPDWASVMIRYTGPRIDQEALLRYLVSFRQHNEFHEQCVERIFSDILQHCQPRTLSVFARYTRRGGLDINPFRTNVDSPMPMARNARQ
ncbi:NADPH-dependent 7-cyano-7-deazaguanine reductase QueF [Aestuariibacter halophilus]|uniref:NADPH-dependent 7-cyano-7-deazaguanine reductase n=1 Tax=Fluctibacter halophilus TaxID=226011 RepID=A0ABS8G4R5_9ALTE|nr:NADPH-dependent 7-cyano-7-deazaguanine reductase QueF [Aestuariibacter halophilus]MCC2614835.1 NADPH-dependent 7-cyano-7-deazaguanine reductase QueF [Aestuariibacter halophilus]